MNITLERIEKELVRVRVDGTPSHSFDPMSLTPEGRQRSASFLQEPQQEGNRLFAALLPPDSLARRALAELDARPEPGLITLVISHPNVRRVPWEYLCDGQGQFLVARHRFARGLPSEQRRDPSPDVSASLLQILAVPADPLCRQDGTPEMRIDVVEAVEDVAEAVRASGGPFHFRTVVPPTLDYLRSEMSQRSLTILHFPGRGRASPDARMDGRSISPALLFEDQAGMVDPITAERLLGGLDEQIFLVFLGADASVGTLAHRLISGGVCYALEMRYLHDWAHVRWSQGPRSADEPIAPRFLRSFYRGLATGHSVKEATRQARVALVSTPGMLGVPVLHVAHAGEGGRIRIDDGGKADVDIRLWSPPPDLVGLPAPAHFRGYRSQLALLGTHWWDGAPVITILGEDGIGKTSLAVQAAHRFRWRFPEGVLGLSLDSALRPAVLLTRLAEWVWGQDYDRRWSSVQLLDELVDHLREQERLLVLDGYETLHPAESMEDEAIVRTVIRLVCRLLGGKTRVLLTGCEVIGLSGEQTVHLGGLSPEAGAALLRALIPGRRWRGDSGTDGPADIDSDRLRSAAFGGIEEESLKDLSRTVGGHPLALELLAGAYASGRESLVQLKRRLEGLLRTQDQSGGTRFLKDVPPGVAACLSIAMDGLPPQPRALMPRLTLFQAPFLGGIAATVFDDQDVPHYLQILAQAHLIRQLSVEGVGEETALYQLHPVVRRLLEPEVSPAALEAPRLRFVVTYTLFAAAALQRFTVPVSRLVGLLLPDLDRALEWAQAEEEWSELAFNLAGLWRQYGLVDEALQLYRDVLIVTDTLGDHKKEAATRAMIGQMLARRGEHAEALHALLTALSTLTRLQATSDVVRVAQIIQALRREIGDDRFQTLWAEVTEDQPLPAWLTDA